MRLFIAATVATALSLTAASAAGADWSTPRTITVHAFSTWTVAVNARGDTAIAWATHGNPAEPPIFRGSVYVAVRRAGGRVRTRRLWSSRRAGVGEVAVALDRRGEATVVWNSNTRRQSIQTEGLGTIRAAYGPLVGHWSQPQVVGRASAEPRLAVAPDRKVLLVWVANAYDGLIAAAWRRPGLPFGAPQGLEALSSFPAVGEPNGAVPAFDARGAAYVTGACDGTVLRARPRSRRLRTIFLRGPVLGLTLSLVGRGGLAAWANGRCTADVEAPDQPGPVFASILHNGRLGARLGLTSLAERASHPRAVAALGGGGTVSWTNSTGVFSAEVRGTVAAPALSPNGIVPFGVDGGGDQVLAGPGSTGTFAQLGVLVRPAGGGPLEPAPVPNGTVAVSTPIGRRIALAWGGAVTGRHEPVTLSLWRP
jgi:hypothetical protein